MPRPVRSQATFLDATQLVADLHRRADDIVNMFAVRVEVLHHHWAGQQPWPAAVLHELLWAVIDSTGSAIYAIAPSDLVLLCNNLSVDRVDAVIGRFSRLVDDGAAGGIATGGIAAGEEAAGEEAGADLASVSPGVRVTWYDLVRSNDVTALTAAAEVAVGAGNGRHRHEALRPFTAADLPSLVERTQSLPLNRMLRRRKVLKMHSLASLEPLFNEISLSLEAFQRTFAPDLDLTADPALFGCLSACFDDALLTHLLAADGAALTRASFGIGVGLRTLQSAPYKRFEEAFAHRDDVFIAIKLDDILRHTDKFIDARTDLHQRGLKIIIDGVSIAAFSHFDLAGLGVDYLKVLFPHGRPFDATHQASGNFMQAIDRLGRHRIICAQVETEEVLKWTLSAGLSCFQGSLIDRWFGVQAAQDGRKPEGGKSEGRKPAGGAR